MHPVFCAHAQVLWEGDPPEADYSFLETRDFKLTSQPLRMAIACCRTLLAAAGLPPEACGEIPLFVATGMPFDSVTGEIRAALRTLRMEGNGAAGLAALERDLPPLTGIKALSNAGAFFICKYAGLRGAGTTFGNTSAAGMAALEAGWRHIRHGRGPYALVGAWDGTGEVSRAAREALTRAREGDCPAGAAAAFFLLESGPFSPEAPGAEVAPGKGRQGAQATAWVRLDSVRIRGHADWNAGHAPWQDLPAEESSLFFHGGVGGEDFRRAQARARSLSPDCHSHYPNRGDAGAAAGLAELASALHALRENRIRRARVLDRDLYGREACVEASRA